MQGVFSFGFDIISNVSLAGLNAVDCVAKDNLELQSFLSLLPTYWDYSPQLMQCWGSNLVTHAC